MSPRKSPRPLVSTESTELRSPRMKEETKRQRQSIFYNASKYDSSSAALSQGQPGYQVVLLGTEYVEATKIGTKPYTVSPLSPYCPLYQRTGRQTYRLRVAHSNGTKWETTRRYREFRSLMEKVKHTLPALRRAEELTSPQTAQKQVQQRPTRLSPKEDPPQHEPSSHRPTSHGSSDVARQGAASRGVGRVPRGCSVPRGVQDGRGAC